MENETYRVKVISTLKDGNETGDYVYLHFQMWNNGEEFLVTKSPEPELKDWYDFGGYVYHKSWLIFLEDATVSNGDE